MYSTTPRNECWHAPGSVWSPGNRLSNPNGRHLAPRRAVSLCTEGRGRLRLIIEDVGSPFDEIDTQHVGGTPPAVRFRPVDADVQQRSMHSRGARFAESAGTQFLPQLVTRPFEAFRASEPALLLPGVERRHLRVMLNTEPFPARSRLEF